MDWVAIAAFLARYGRAISHGEISVILESWGIPALVMSGEGALAVNDSAEVARFFAEASKQYAARGLVETRPEIEEVQALGNKLVTVRVRWPAFDAAGEEKAVERSLYILRSGDDGKPRIQVAITLPE